MDAGSRGRHRLRPAFCGDDSLTDPKTFRSGDSLFFNNTVSGAVTLSVTGSDTASTIVSVGFDALGGTTTGWTPTTALTGQPNGATRTYSWSVGGGSPTFTGTANNAAGVTGTSALLSLISDSSGPVATFSTPASSTSQTILSIDVAWSENDGLGSGVASRSLKRQIAPVNAGACGAFVDDAGPPVTSASPSPQSLVPGNCYRWVQTLTDNVGNVASTTSGTVLVGTGSGLPAPSAPDLDTASDSGPFEAIDKTVPN